ncbi:hypothetical protein DVH24_042011 [Malus domestica]|uniref:Glycolipid transfer protein domain-containing protein n=1 Tax=Malus domestica TaxID=3750 RepID=A0A498IV40_MALDO|nr:hypothetical protein DVH24_042011 [Malus domestica]
MVNKNYRMARVVGRKDEKILTRLADEFEQLAAQLNSPVPTMEIDKFTQSCRLVSPLIRHLGVAMKFADIEYSAKVSGVLKAGKSVNTLEDLLDRDIQKNTIKHFSSSSRMLIRVKRSLELLKIIFEKIMASSENTLMDPVNTAYKQVFYPYYGWASRKTVAGALQNLPTKSLFFKRLKVDEASAFVQMQRTVTALDHLIHYIDNLFRSRESVQDTILSVLDSDHALTVLFLGTHVSRTSQWVTQLENAWAQFLLNFGFPMEREASELPKSLVLEYLEDNPV